MRWLLAALCLSFAVTCQASVVITVNGKPVDKNQVLKPAPSSLPVRPGQNIDKVLVIKSARKLELISNGKPVTKALFRQMLAEEMRVIQDELGEHRFSSGRFDDAARLMEQITTSDDLIDFLTLPGYRFLA